MDYTTESQIKQVEYSEKSAVQECLLLPSALFGFHNTATTVEQTKSGRDVFVLYGELSAHPADSVCPKCGRRMHIHGSYPTCLRHLNFGGKLSCVCFEKSRYYCPACRHRKNVVKEIDMKRLQEKYTIDGKKLIQPERQAKFLGIDEFKLHDGHKYATSIIDMETGHILWLAHGKKKAVVYGFIDHVGLEWMDGVEAVACDMNSDFQEAFEERCPHIQPVFDYFHIVKNFNDKVVSEIRKDEQCRLIEEGQPEAAAKLKKTKYILTSSRQTLQRKDEEAADGKVIAGGGTLFPQPEVVRKIGYVERYETLLRENKLFFTIDLIKEKLTAAYALTDEAKMATEISEIMDLCRASENEHLLWFCRLLDSHFEGIIAYATYNISAGKLEGINNKIKTLRRQGYGYPDDDYFFLKLFDASRKSYTQNPKSHKKKD